MLGSSFACNLRTSHASTVYIQLTAKYRQITVDSGVLADSEWSVSSLNWRVLYHGSQYQSIHVGLGIKSQGLKI